MTDRWTILLGGVGQTRCRVRNLGRALVTLCEDIDPQLKAQGWPEGTPFKTISIIVRYGGIEPKEALIGRINDHRELEAAVYFPVENSRNVEPASVLAARIRPLILTCLKDASSKYSVDPPDVV